MKNILSFLPATLHQRRLPSVKIILFISLHLVSYCYRSQGPKGQATAVIFPKGELACSPGQRSCPGGNIRNTNALPNGSAGINPNIYVENDWDPALPFGSAIVLDPFSQGSYADLGYKPFLPSGEKLNSTWDFCNCLFKLLSCFLAAFFK